MNPNKKNINEQDSGGQTATSTSTMTLKDAIQFGCFSKERYPWFTIDSGEQPKKTTQPLSGATYNFPKGDEVLTGVNSKGQPVYFKYESGTGGKYYGLATGKVFEWDCPQVLEYLNKINTFIDEFIKNNGNYTKKDPGLYGQSTNYQKVDVSTLDKTGTIKPGLKFIYKKIGINNKRIDQYPNIETALKSAGYTFQEPDVTTPEYDKFIDISRVLGAKYKPFFDEMKKRGEDTRVWPLRDSRISRPNVDLTIDTTGNTITGGSSAKEALKQAKLGRLNRGDCKKWIKGLYKLRKSQIDINDSDLLIYKRNVYACYVQNMNFSHGAFGVGDELNKLATDPGKYGINDLIRGTGSMNESKKLKNIIKENLIKKSKQKHEILLSENTIINNRYKVLVEGSAPKSKQELKKFVDLVITETASLHNQGLNEQLIKEGFLDLLKGVFGQASTGIFQYFKEQIGRWLLDKLGMDTNSWMGNVIISAIGNVPLTELHNLTNCSFLSNILSKSVAEGALNKIKNEKGLVGPGYDILRNSLVELAEDSSFGQKIEHKISEFICPSLQKIKGNLDGVTDKMKTKALGLEDKTKHTSTSDSGNLLSKGVDKVKGMLSK